MEVDPRVGELRGNGIKIRVQDQPFQLPVALLGRELSYLEEVPPLEGSSSPTIRVVQNMFAECGGRREDGTQ
ncbi:MAG: hypothetical protein GY953_46785 [bacterium]|nr:hypothetical protein [bacterium]